jgi:hypothetical protein
MRVDVFGNEFEIRSVFDIDNAGYPHSPNKISCYDNRVNELLSSLKLSQLTHEEMLFYDKKRDVLCLYAANLGYALEVLTLDKEKDAYGTVYSLDGLYKIYKMGDGSKNTYYNILPYYLDADRISDYLEVLRFILSDEGIIPPQEVKVGVNKEDSGIFFKCNTIPVRYIKSDNRLIIPCAALNRDTLGIFLKMLLFILDYLKS